MRLCDRGGSRAWQGLLGRPPDWGIGPPGQRVSANDRLATQPKVIGPIRDSTICFVCRWRREECDPRQRECRNGGRGGCGRWSRSADPRRIRHVQHSVHHRGRTAGRGSRIAGGSRAHTTSRARQGVTGCNSPPRTRDTAPRPHPKGLARRDVGESDSVIAWWPISTAVAQFRAHDAAPANRASRGGTTTVAASVASAWLRSRIRSPTSSVPTEIRRLSSNTPARSRT